MKKMVRHGGSIIGIQLFVERGSCYQIDNLKCMMCGFCVIFTYFIDILKPTVLCIWNKQYSKISYMART